MYEFDTYINNSTISKIIIFLLLTLATNQIIRSQLQNNFNDTPSFTFFSNYWPLFIKTLFVTPFLLSVESCTTLLSKELKRNLFQLFATWSGSLSKPLGVMYHVSSGTQISTDDERLQFSALQVCLLQINHLVKMSFLC